jgi:Ca-activated chloride channel family protein
MNYAIGRSLVALLALILSLALGCDARAQERFILLVDGSGSMWRQIDGKPKIFILREAIGKVIGQIDPKSEVGIVAFGHREKGNCSDIEEILAPVPFDPLTVQAAVDGIEPKGMTPLSDGVRVAAESLKFTEQKATVVILGDGEETCNADPCVVAEELEATGVDLTVHAIAFDIADENGTAQLRCFAEKTGGLFLPVADMPELVDALSTVAEEVALPTLPLPVPTELVAVNATTRAALEEPVTFTIGTATGPLTLDGQTGRVRIDFIAGRYVVEAVAEHGRGELTLVVPEPEAGVAPQSLVVEVPLVIKVPTGVRLVVLDALTGAAVQGEPVWTFINQETEEVFEFAAASGTHTTEIPPGRYDVFAIMGEAYGETSVDVTESGITEVVLSLGAATQTQIAVDAESYAAGSGVSVSWTFDPVQGDLVFLAKLDMAENSYPIDDWRRFVVSTEQAATLTAPPEPGSYELRYFRPDSGLLHRLPIRVTAAEVTLSAPGNALAGESVVVDWSGPGLPGDFLYIAPTEWRANEYPSRQSDRIGVEGGSPLSIPVPEREGHYELRYFSHGGGQALYSIPFEVGAAAAGLSVPTAVAAGATFEARFTGPKAEGDLIFVAPLDMDPNRYPISDDAKKAAAGPSPAKLVAPVAEGNYEVRYYSPNKGGTLARAALNVTPAQVAIDADRTVARGAPFTFRVTGPLSPGDIVFIAAADWGDNQYPLGNRQQFAPGPDGNGQWDAAGSTEFSSVAPAEPGRYEIRYFSWANGTTLAKRILIVR